MRTAEKNVVMQQSEVGTVPLLVGLAIRRTGDAISLPGSYDSQKKVWVQEDGEPIVSAAADLAELVTKTFERAERDDPDSNSLLDIVTKTEARPERDDVPRDSLAGLMDLVTKTKARQERDDQ